MEPPGVCRTSATPGSTNAAEALSACAWPAWVAELRFCGIYLPAQLIASRRISAGHLVSLDANIGIWHCHLFTDKPSSIYDPARIHGLFNVHKVRRSGDNTYLLHGEAWDDGYLRSWPQTWLCAGNKERVLNTLDGMAAWLQEHYRGTYRAHG